jgi:ATP-dependent Lon protease
LERLVTTSQAAEILGLSLQGVHYRIKKNQLKSVKQSGKTFVYISDEIPITNTTNSTNNQKIKVEPVISQNTNQNNYSDAVIEGKNEQIVLLKKSLKWMKRQYISEISRLEKNQKRIIDVFNSEIKLLQSAFNEMRSIYKPQIQAQREYEPQKEEIKFISLKDFFVFMKRNNKSEQEIKYTIFRAIKKGDKRFIYNKVDKKLLILDSDFMDLI